MSFVVPDDAYAMMTPYGTLAAYFPEDGPVLWTGAQEAKEYFAAMLRSFTPPSGFGYTMETLGADDLADMQMPAGWAILVREPLEVAQPDGDNGEVISPPPDPESAPKWPVLNPVKLEDV